MAMLDQSKSRMIKKIIDQLKTKDGIYGYCAKIYCDDMIIASQFIIECADHCKTSLAINDWGDELIKDILEYKKKFDM